MKLKIHADMSSIMNSNGLIDEFRLRDSKKIFFKLRVGLWPEHQEGVKLDYDGSKVSYKCD